LLVTFSSGFQILVDTPPELRVAAIDNGVDRVDAVLYTHSHADHIFGLDDIRAFNLRQGRAIPLYAEKDVLSDIRRCFDYCFKVTQLAGGKPQLSLKPIEPGHAFQLDNLEILPLRVYHGTLPVLGFRFGGKAAYVTDVSRIPDETWPYLEGLDLLFLDAVRRQPHPTHFHLAAALDAIGRLKPKSAFLVHLSHDYDHAETNSILPAGVALPYDGQVIELA